MYLQKYWYKYYELMLIDHIRRLQLFDVAELCGLVPDHPSSDEQTQLSRSLLGGSTMDSSAEGKSSDIVSSIGVFLHNPYAPYGPCVGDDGLHVHYFLFTGYSVPLHCH